MVILYHILFCLLDDSQKNLGVSAANCRTTWPKDYIFTLKSDVASSKTQILHAEN